MSHGALIADEQAILRTAETPLVGTLSGVNVKREARRASSKLSKITYRVVKRTFDLAFGLIGCLLTPPLAIFVKLAYMLTGDFGPIFFVQKRIGKNGREFRFFKFRTMVKDADEALEEALKDPEAKAYWKKYKKLKHDPRVTKLGHLLRRTSLDEFPQFWNVLKGDMSLIGNRPYMPREKCDIADHVYDELLSTKPGITGYWQVSGRSNIGFEERIQLESYYSQNASFRFDCAIFFRTFKSVLSADGAD